MLAVREIGEKELPRLVGVHNHVLPREATTPLELLDWRRQAEDTVWLLASNARTDAGAGIGVHGWHAEPGVVRTLAFVLEGSRGRGLGSRLLAELERWASSHGAHTSEGTVEEDDPASTAWLARRGFGEHGRNSRLALDLRAIETPEVEPPRGVEIVTWAERPELAGGMYDVALEAFPDVPGEEATVVPPFESWLANDMRGAGDRTEATFVAVAGSAVVGYAKLAFPDGRPREAVHDITAVARAWRRRGVAGALKRAEIAWARRHGYERLETRNEERNTPIRVLNELHGYRLEPGTITMRRPLAG